MRDTRAGKGASAPAAGDAGQARSWSTTPGQLGWLQAQLPLWREEGLIDAAAATAIAGRYVAHRRFSLVRLVMALGGMFVAVGLIWLVAANLDTMSPLVRFALVAAVWVGLLLGGEVVAARRAAEGDSSSPLVGVLHALATAAVGAVIFQAAQSLNVPAYTPGLVGLWGLAALVHGYSLRAASSVLIGAGLLTGWFVWGTVIDAPSFVSGVTALLVAGCLATAVAVLHESHWWPALSGAWGMVGALLVLIGVFVAALPVRDQGRLGWWSWFVVVVVLAVLAALAALAGADTLDRRVEVLVPVAALSLAVLLVLWGRSLPEDVFDVTALTPGLWLRAVVAVAGFVAVAGWYAVMGVRRDRLWLTSLATAALVLFVTVQSFAVFAPVISGATLFLAVGAVLLASGVLADRGRRRLITHVGTQEES